MNLRNVICGSVVVLALTAAFGFKPLRGTLPASVKFYAGSYWYCVADQVTDQPNCTNSSSGPVCTVTLPGAPPSTAYLYLGTADCTTVLRQY